MAPVTILKGTLDLLILKSLSLGELHGLGIARRIEQITGSAFNPGPGSLFPALHRLEHAGRPGCKEPNDNSGRRGRRRGRRTAEVAMVACVAGRRVGRSLVGCRVCVSAAMANDRKRVDRRSCRTRRLSTPQGGVQGDHGDRHYPQEPSEACTHALLDREGGLSDQRCGVLR